MASSCSDSDEPGEDSSSRNNRSRSSSVRTIESSFTAEDDKLPQQSAIVGTGTDPPGTAANTEAAVMVDCLSEEFLSKLEWNFKKDHLLREGCTDLKEAVSDTVKQGQVSIYHRSRNFRVKKLLYDKYLCKKIFVGTTPFPH